MIYIKAIEIICKVERIGHNTYIIPTRVNSLSRIQNCPSNYNGLVLYRREMQVYDTYIECIYTAQEKYVLENYFTSIQSKQRAWQLAEDYYIRNDIDNYYIEFSNNAKSSSYEIITYLLTYGHYVLVL